MCGGRRNSWKALLVNVAMLSLVIKWPLQSTRALLRKCLAQGCFAMQLVCDNVTVAKGFGATNPRGLHLWTNPQGIQMPSRWRRSAPSSRELTGPVNPPRRRGSGLFRDHLQDNGGAHLKRHCRDSGTRWPRVRFVNGKDMIAVDVQTKTRHRMLRGVAGYLYVFPQDVDNDRKG